MKNDASGCFSIHRLAVLGMMTALVFASNYARIVIPIAIGGQTAFTLANITCCLSGLLLGPVGGLASGLGSALFDLTHPAYVHECWITFITKGAMGLFAGLAVRSWLARRDELNYPQALFGALSGCIAYYLLYFVKVIAYNGMFLEGLPLNLAVGVVSLKIPSTIFNAAVALLGAPPLSLAIRAALKRGGLGHLLRS